MLEESLPFSNITTFRFAKQPIPLPPDLRPMWKISQILLVLKMCSRSEKASLLKLQLFNWALASSDSMEQLISYIRENEEGRKPNTIRLVPSLNRAVEFAVGEDLIDIDRSGKFTLTHTGDTLAKRIINDDELFAAEKRSLRFLGLSVSEVKVKNLLKG